MTTTVMMQYSGELDDTKCCMQFAAGSVPKYPLHFWQHFFTGPATRRKGVLWTMALAGSVVVALAAVSQHELASQLYSMAL